MISSYILEVLHANEFISRDRQNIPQSLCTQNGHYVSVEFALKRKMFFYAKHVVELEQQHAMLLEHRTPGNYHIVDYGS